MEMPRHGSNIPGSHGWKPSEADVEAAGRPNPGLTLRVLSVLPFILLGAFSVIATVAWVMVAIFGAGTGRGPVWVWAAGHSTGEVIGQVALAVLIGLVPVAFIVLSIWATLRGFGTEPAPLFWVSSEICFAAAALALVVGRVQFPGVMEYLALVGQQWWFALAFVGYGLTVSHMRVRREREVLDRMRPDD
jgi:hypothetical protein